MLRALLMSVQQSGMQGENQVYVSAQRSSYKLARGCVTLAADSGCFSAENNDRIAGLILSKVYRRVTLDGSSSRLFHLG